MRNLFNIGDILGAIISSKMTGDVRTHAGWALKTIAGLSVLAYLLVRT